MARDAVVAEMTRRAASVAFVASFALTVAYLILYVTTGGGFLETTSQSTTYVWMAERTTAPRPLTGYGGAAHAFASAYSEGPAAGQVDDDDDDAPEVDDTMSELIQESDVLESAADAPSSPSSTSPSSPTTDPTSATTSSSDSEDSYDQAADQAERVETLVEELVESMPGSESEPKKTQNFGLRDLSRFFDAERVKADRARALGELDALRTDDAEYDLFKSSGERNLVFIKLHKTGSTSVAASLFRVAKEYEKKALMTTHCDPGSSYEIFFRHAPRKPWMDECLPNAIYVTVLREPKSRYISLHTWMTNRNYFINLPSRPCNYTKPNPDPKPTGKKLVCRDDAARRRYVKRRFKDKLANVDPDSHPCEPCTWLNPSSELVNPSEPESVVKRASENFSLIGTTKHLDAFLLLLALRFDWSLEAILYEKCKQQHGAGVHVSDFDDDLETKTKIEALTSRESAVYHPFATKFDAYLGRLGPGFRDLLEDFKRGLNNYHAQLNEGKGANQDRWIPARKHSMYC